MALFLAPDRMAPALVESGAQGVGDEKVAVPVQHATCQHVWVTEGWGKNGGTE